MPVSTTSSPTSSSSSSRRNAVIISIAALLGLTTVASLTYLYLKDKDSQKSPSSNRRFRTLQKHLVSQLLSIENDLDSINNGDLRLAQVRNKTLRTHPCFPGDHKVDLPSLGLLKDGDENEVEEIKETKEELIRERGQGFDDPVKVRKGYHQLTLLIQSVRERLLKLVERIESVDLDELAELGDSKAGSVVLPQVNGYESENLQVFEKIRRRQRSITVKAQKSFALVDQLSLSFKERIHRIQEFERLEKLGLEPTDEAAPTVDNELMKAGVSFAEVASLNVPELEVLAPTGDLEKMKSGVSFADVASSNIEEPEVLAPTEDLEKMKAGISFADVAAKEQEPEPDSAPAPMPESKPKNKKHQDEEFDVREEHVLTFSQVVMETVPGKKTMIVTQGDDEEYDQEQQEVEEEEEEVLAPTEDLELMKEGVTYAEMASHNTSSSEHQQHGQEILAPTEDLEMMKGGITFAEMASHNTSSSEQLQQEENVFAPTEDVRKMKQGLTFAEAVAEE
ncbi:hypothetical protein BGZ83_008092 [Gryganskiella cystojenkinii]|nr:hypothetical protein BGZ83_008092 [Gryganskiella cystojenkinii]